MRISKTAFVVSVIAAALAIAGAYRILEAPKSHGVIRRPVVVALRDIPEGQVIDRTSLTVTGFPLGTVPVGAYAAADSVIGRVARLNIFKGEAIVPGRLVPAVGR